MKVRIMILLLFLSTMDVQGDCTPVDLRGPKLGQVRNQDSMGWCFAFAAADILSYKMAQKISAADIAHRRSVAASPDDQFDIGKKGYNPPNAIRETREKGWCLEKDFPSEDNISGVYFDLFKKISELKKQMAEGKKIKEEEACGYLKNAFPNLDDKTALKILKDSGLKDYYTMLANQNCPNRVKDTGITIEEVKKGTPGSDLLKTIDAQLNDKNVVAINYNHGVLSNPAQKEAKITHSSLIVGRRYNTASKSCEYLIRNSWGRSCGYYHSDLHCEEGHIWVPAGSLLNNTAEVYYAK